MATLTKPRSIHSNSVLSSKNYPSLKIYHINYDAKPALIRSLCVQLRSTDFTVSDCIGRLSNVMHAWLIPLLWNWCEICFGHSLSADLVRVLLVKFASHGASYWQCWHMWPFAGRCRFLCPWKLLTGPWWPMMVLMIMQSCACLHCYRNLISSPQDQWCKCIW